MIQPSFNSPLSPVYKLALAWILLPAMLFFVARGTFSFDRAQYFNSPGLDAGTVPEAPFDTSYYRFQRFFMYGLVGGAICLSLRKTICTAWTNRAVLTLPMLAILSTLWSQDRDRSLFFGMLALSLTLFGIFLGQRFPRERSLELVFLVGCMAVAMSYAMIVLMPANAIRHVDDSGAWQGMFVHKNHLGIVMVYLLTPVLYLGRTSLLNRFAAIVYFAAILLLIVKSQSRTAWLEVVALLGYYLFEKLYMRAGRRERLLAAGLAVFAVALLAGVAYFFGSDIAVSLGKSSDMTGRTGIFQVLLPELWKRPVFGFGYQAFWLGLKGESANLLLTPGHALLSNAENGVMQMWLELGAVGTFVLLFLLFRSCRNALLCLSYDTSRYLRWSSAILMLSLLSLVNGDKYMYPNTIEWVLFVLAYVNLAEAAKRIRQNDTHRMEPAWAS